MTTPVAVVLPCTKQTQLQICVREHRNERIMEQLLEQYAHAAETPDVFYTAVLSFALLAIGVFMVCVETYDAVKQKTSELSNAPLFAVLSIVITYVVVVVGVLSSGYVRYSDYTAVKELEPQVAQAIKDDIHKHYDVDDVSLGHDTLTTIADSYRYDDESMVTPVSVTVSPETMVVWDAFYFTEHDRIVFCDSTYGDDPDNSNNVDMSPREVVKQ